MTASLFTPLILPNGQRIRNRIAKAAMEENLAAPGQLPGKEHRNLYRAWGDGGSGLVITGNVMVSQDHVTSPHGIVLDADQPLGPFREWAKAARKGGAQAWMQINHPGRLVKTDLGLIPLAPSRTAVTSQENSWPLPEAMTEHQVQAAVRQYEVTAALAAEAGFTGVQIHGAHGYLISQFLSPLANRRTDRWGGSLENRSRFLFEVVDRVRAVLPSTVALSIKLNTADFQRGGFDQADAGRVVRRLNAFSPDLLELSGGTVEAPAMHGALPTSTRARESYFLELVQHLVKIAEMPLMLTGGISSRKGAQAVIDGGLDMVGIGTALAVVPDLPERWHTRRYRFIEPVSDLNVDGPTRSAQKQAWVRRALRARAQGQTIALATIDLEECARSEAERRSAGISDYLRWLKNRPVRLD